MGNAFAILFTTPGIPLLYYGDEMGLNGAGDPDNRHMMYFDGLSAGQSLLLAEVKKLTQIRAAHPALRKGQFQSLGSTNDTLAYTMSLNGDQLWVAINRSDNDQPVGNLPSQSFMDLLSGTALTGPSVTVPARSAVILAAQNLGIRAELGSRGDGEIRGRFSCFSVGDSDEESSAEICAPLRDLSKHSPSDLSPSPTP
jgi:hypothetical protein